MVKETAKKRMEGKADRAEKDDDFQSVAAMEIDGLRARVAELEDSLLRARADQENYRKRMEREREELVERACSSLVEDLLPVLDHFQLGLKAAEEAGGHLVSGFAMIFDQLRQLLARRGLETLGAVGEAFDPNWAEAVALVPSADVPRDHISQVLRPGYRMGRRLLRPASVVISAGESADQSGDGAEEVGADRSKQ
ncbi:MAG: nucleotide exchange factor GrpE [Puniceicoccales bacterium]|jgi:molecular chaperone GrpE|nr:nucleotide exchange factor GrpE [Puniceicoccales bacterium]